MSTLVIMTALLVVGWVVADLLRVLLRLVVLCALCTFMCLTGYHLVMQHAPTGVADAVEHAVACVSTAGRAAAADMGENLLWIVDASRDHAPQLEDLTLTEVTATWETPAQWPRMERVDGHPR